MKRQLQAEHEDAQDADAQEGADDQVREWDEWNAGDALGPSESDSDDAHGAHGGRKRKAVHAINNKTAMEKKLRTIRLATAAGHALPWIETMTLTYDKSHEGVVDSHQDLQRELGFYTQAKDALDKGAALLEEANVAIDRPGDYFAEMVKSDEHMEYIRLKLAKQKRRLERIDEKKRETELKKFGKAKQREKKQEKLRHKKQETDAVKTWAKKRKQGQATDDELEKIVVGNKKARVAPQQGEGKRGPPKKTKKQEYKDKKFGANARKPAGSKRNSFDSARDMTSFDVKKNRSPFAGGAGGKKSFRGGKPAGGGNRPGKQRRQSSNNHNARK